MTAPYKPKLIEVAIPLEAISDSAVAEKSIRMGHPANLHTWWARRPLVAARAVLWASLVDDPSGHPDKFPTEEKQSEERERLYGILKRLVVWENSNDPDLLMEARKEIELSCDYKLPNILDPFSGGGTIVLESQRLGLPSFGGDLNPVSVLISKALIEIPGRFIGMKPVNPESCNDSGLKTWEGVQGLVEDIRYYGELMRLRASELIGHLYPKVQLPANKGGGLAKVIAYIWARTVTSPDPAWGRHVPLVRSWVLWKKGGKPMVWVEPIVDRNLRSISYKIRTDGDPVDSTIGRGGGVCIVTGAKIGFDYIREQGKQGQLGEVLLGIVAEGDSGRVYLDPVTIPDIPEPSWKPDIRLPNKTLGFRVQRYGMTMWSDLFTDRQLVALSTFSDLLSEVRSLIRQHAKQSGKNINGDLPFREGGSGVEAYVDTIVTYLAFAIDKLASRSNSLVCWGEAVQCPLDIFSRHAISMVWDFAESNPLSSSSGSWKLIINNIVRTFSSKAWPPPNLDFYSEIKQESAINRLSQIDKPVVCTDPPYYDNVPFADLSDFYYVWLRHNLYDIWPNEFRYYLTPKGEELVANAERAGSRELARRHFEDGMESFMVRLAKVHNPDFPATIFYAFKQQETKQGETISTGWETFLQGLVSAGLQVQATWPIRTERRGRLRAHQSAALTSSVIIVCRRRSLEAKPENRGDFVSALKKELPDAVRLLQKQSIAPVDMAQSAIGPGMRIFSRYSKVVEADGSAMSVRTALAHINEVLGEVLSEEESELDADSRFALTWFEQFGYEAGPYGDADVLARAKVTAVDGVVEAGIAESRGGRVRLLRREELEEDWSPAEDKRRTDWEAAQHLIRLLDRSEVEAAGLLGRLGGVGDRARQLAYLLYAVCEEKKWSEEAVAYNGLITAWPELTRLVATTGAEQHSIL